MNSDPRKYDLIFMDIIMPNMDGVTATGCIRVEQNPVPIVAMTANINPDDIQLYTRESKLILGQE